MRTRHRRDRPRPHPGEGPPRLTRRRALLGAAGAVAAAAASPAPALARRGDPAGTRVADLSHVFSEDFPLYPGSAPTTREVLVTVPANGYYGQRWTLWEHACTHMDAPAHFDADGRTTPQLRPDELVVPAVVVDIAARAARDPDTVVTADDLRAFKRRHGRIPRGAIVCMHSGWESRAAGTETYRNADAGGTMRFPASGWRRRSGCWPSATPAPSASTRSRSTEGRPRRSTCTTRGAARTATAWRTCGG